VFASGFEASAAIDMSAIMAPENLPKVRKAIDEEFARAIKDGFSEEEVKLGREGLLKLRSLSRAQDSNLARSLGRQAELSRSFAFAKAIDEKLSKMSAAEVDAAFKKYFVPERFYTVSAGSLEKK
jgi:zinc protease